ncbi:MAG: hypothetical protein IIZ67_04820 [Bacilli bacterium]|nr:hypothetical protein [Bacilli bacterium]
MKIKVIDLINKIDNKEELPQKVKFEKEIYEYDKKRKDYINKYDDWTSQTLLYRVMSTHFISELLECKVEIIEDEEEIDIQSIDIIRDYRTSEDDLYNDNFEDFRGTINELVQAVKQLDKNIKELNK